MKKRWLIASSLIVVWQCMVIFTLSFSISIVMNPLDHFKEGVKTKTPHATLYGDVDAKVVEAAVTLLETEFKHSFKPVTIIRVNKNNPAYFLLRDNYALYIKGERLLLINGEVPYHSETAISHELFHAYVDGTDVPLWLEEGAAQKVGYDLTQQVEFEPFTGVPTNELTGATLYFQGYLTAQSLSYDELERLFFQKASIDEFVKENDYKAFVYDTDFLQSIYEAPKEQQVRRIARLLELNPHRMDTFDLSYLLLKASGPDFSRWDLLRGYTSNTEQYELLLRTPEVMLSPYYELILADYTAFKKTRAD